MTSAYPVVWWRSKVSEILTRYDQFCESFIRTSYLSEEWQDNSGVWRASTTEQCRIHWSNKMNIMNMCYNTKIADVYLYYDASDVKTPIEQHAKFLFDSLRTINSKNFKLYIFSPRAKQNMICDGYEIYKMKEYLIEGFDEQKKIKFPSHVEYVNHWGFNPDDIPLFETLWDDIKTKV